MKNLQSFISSIVSLWDMHQHRENFYKKVLTMHNLGTLRRVCSQGYFSSMLYKKEIQWVYDLTKSTLDDGDINEHIVNKSRSLFDSEGSIFPGEKLIQLENETIKMYRDSLSRVGYKSEETYILTDHLEKLCDINLTLSRELKNGFLFKQSRSMPVVSAL